MKALSLKNINLFAKATQRLHHRWKIYGWVWWAYPVEEIYPYFLLWVENWEYFIFPSRLIGRTSDFDSGNVCSKQASGATPWMEIPNNARVKFRRRLLSWSISHQVSLGSLREKILLKTSPRKVRVISGVIFFYAYVLKLVKNKLIYMGRYSMLAKRTVC